MFVLRYQNSEKYIYNPFDLIFPQLRGSVTNTLMCIIKTGVSIYAY